MKLKSTKREYNETWVQTASLVITLVFTLLATFGVLTPAQTTEATPIVGTTLGAISTVVVSIIQLIGIFFKAEPTV